MRPLNVHLLPELVPEEQLAGGLVVVIDVLRATTTIVHALAAGARQVIPCLHVDDARQRAADFAPGDALLGGERGGVPIAGFDLGNSPEDYTAEKVRGRTVVFSTTNGTKAMQRCQPAARMLIGAFSNLVAVCRALRDSSAPIHLLCAGTDGQITREDTLLAGTVVHLLLVADPQEYQLNDPARIAADVGRQTVGAALALNHRDALVSSLIQALRDSLGGRNLIELGLDRDIVRAAQTNLFTIVPELGLKTWSITASAADQDCR